MPRPFYNKKKAHTTQRLRNWTIYEYSSPNQRKDYDIYYIDSEWNAAGNGVKDIVEFTGLQNAFNDGSKWMIAGENANSTGTFTCIIVRKKGGRVVKKCVGVASGEKLANNTLWTVTDVTGEVHHGLMRRLRLLGHI